MERFINELPTRVQHLGISLYFRPGAEGRLPAKEALTLFSLLTHLTALCFRLAIAGMVLHEMERCHAFPVLILSAAHTV